MVRRLIGYATTNSSGIASITYTGQGVGAMNIIAESGGEVLFSDIGTSGTGYTQFYNYATFNPVVSSTGTLLTNSGSTTANYFANLGSTGDLYDFEAPFILEFDIVDFTGTYVGTQIAESGQSGLIKNFSQLGITGACHLKITVTGNQIIYQVDDNTPVTENYSITKARVSLTLNSGTLKYKNFFIHQGRTSLTSNPYELLDCGFYDEATNSNHKTVSTTTSGTGSWLNVSGNLNVAYSDNGTAITNVDSTTTARHFFYHDTTITDVQVGSYNSILNNSTIEFRVNGTSGTPELYLTDGTNNKSIPLNSTGNYKIVLDGSDITFYLNDEEQTLTGSTAMTGTNIRVSFLLNTNTESVTFKQFKVYPI